MQFFQLSMEPYISAGFTSGQRNPADYQIEVVGPGEGHSTALDVSFFRSLPARPTNVRVYRLDPDGAGGSRKVEVDYAFWDLTGDDFVGAGATTPATFSADREIGGSLTSSCSTRRFSAIEAPPSLPGALG